MNVKDKKGSVTVFVLVGLLFMSSFLLISYASNVNRSKISKEQFNMMSDIYSKHRSDVETYNTVYAEIRSKNKKELQKESLNSTSIVLNKTFEENLVNYRIYGNLSKQIVIRVIDQDANSKEYTINLLSNLQSNEYIDFKTQSVKYSNGNTKEIVSLPPIDIYEEYTRIQIKTGGTPSKMVIDYVGYEI